MPVTADNVAAQPYYVGEALVRQPVEITIGDDGSCIGSADLVIPVGLSAELERTTAVSRDFSVEPVEATDSLLIKRWTKAAQLRFDRLVYKEAMGTLSEREADELERIDAARQNIFCQTTFQELVQLRKRAQASLNLISAIKAYQDVTDETTTEPS